MRNEEVTLETFRDMLKRESHMAPIDLMSSDRALSAHTTSLAAEVANANVRNREYTDALETYYKQKAHEYNEWMITVAAESEEINKAFELLRK